MAKTVETITTTADSTTRAAIGGPGDRGKGVTPRVVSTGGTPSTLLVSVLSGDIVAGDGACIRVEVIEVDVVPSSEAVGVDVLLSEEVVEIDSVFPVFEGGGGGGGEVVSVGSLGSVGMTLGFPTSAKRMWVEGSIDRIKATM